MRHDPSNLLLFLGHFHPLLVHLPIGGLVLLGVLELVSIFTRWKDAAQNSRWILGFVCGTVLVSAACGWMLGHASGYDRHLLDWHRRLGFALCAACLITFLLQQWQRIWSYRIALFATLGLLAVTGHLGGSITHGRGFLTRYGPGPLRALLGEPRVREAARPSASFTRQPVFAGIIEPILQERCVACHRGEKHKADLRLDSLEGLLRGGQDGTVIKPGQAKASLAVQRMLLPLDADDHMPPQDQPQPTAQEIALIEWWINAGAPATEDIHDLQPKPEILRLLEVVSKQPQLAR